VVSESKDDTHTIVMMFPSSAKLPWALATVFSCIYLGLFVQVSSGPQETFPDYNFDGLMGGFCVWGAPLTPNNKTGCVTANNSHMYAWYEDAILTLVVLVAYLGSSHQQQQTQRFQYVAIGGIVFFHGMLHWFLYTQLETSCVIPAGVSHGGGWILYSVFTFFLCLLIFGMGFPGSLEIVLGGSLAATLVTYLLAKDAGTDWLLTALFATSHPIGAITGWASTSKGFFGFMGWCFLLATIVGIVELMGCEAFLKPLGGHIWYDLFLHTSVIASLPIFVEKQSGKKKKG
jgi:hypothetical protein